MSGSLRILSLIEETGDFHRFKKGNPYAAYLGLAPGEHSMRMDILMKMIGEIRGRRARLRLLHVKLNKQVLRIKRFVKDHIQREKSSSNGIKNSSECGPSIIVQAAVTAAKAMGSYLTQFPQKQNGKQAGSGAFQAAGRPAGTEMDQAAAETGANPSTLSGIMMQAEKVLEQDPENIV